MKAHVKPDASPGVPCAKTALQNDTLLATLGERFNDEVLDRIEKILAIDLSSLALMERKERLDRGLMDPVRVFVKNEPHKLKKLEEGRVRLISSVSITDKMIEMLLSRHLCKLELANWKLIPSKPGIGFSPLDNEHVWREVTECGYQMSYADVSGWDMSVKGWMILDEAEAIIKLCNEPSQVFKHLIRAKAILESESIYQFSDGELVAPLFKGIVNSGKLRTSRGNSFMRVRIADLVGSRCTKAAGDDTVENTVERPFEKYRRFGIELKEYVPVTDSFEFCSHVYTRHGAHAVNYEKMVMNLLHQDPKSFLEYRMLMIGFEDELRTRPDFVNILRDIESVGFYEVEGPHIDTTSYQDEFQDE